MGPGARANSSVLDAIGCHGRDNMGASAYNVIAVETIEGTSDLSCKPANNYLAKTTTDAVKHPTTIDIFEGPIVVMLWTIVSRMPQV